MPEDQDPYGADYEKQLFEKLAPEVEQMVSRLFPHTRGARFGAQGSILARRLASLRTEIALDAAKRRAEQKERVRREDRSVALERERRAERQSETLRRETQSRGDQSRNEMLADQRYREQMRLWAETNRDKLTPDTLKRMGLEHLVDTRTPGTSFAESDIGRLSDETLDEQESSFGTGEKKPLRGFDANPYRPERMFSQRSFGVPRPGSSTFSPSYGGRGTFADTFKSSGFSEPYSRPSSVSLNAPSGVDQDTPAYNKRPMSWGYDPNVRWGEPAGGSGGRDYWQGSGKVTKRTFDPDTYARGFRDFFRF